MLQDERGMTHINNTEILSEKVSARKDFVLAVGDVADGKLYFYRRGDRHPYESDGERMHVSVNGRRLKPVRELASTGWSYVNVPAEVLQKGLNTFVFSGGGRLLVENSSYPNRSARSVDGGATWDYEHLGEQGMNDGEYLVRLRLERYPAVVALMSEVIDLAALAADEGIYPQVKWARVRLRAEADKPKGTMIRLEARSSANGEDWCPWDSATKVTRNEKLPRYFQWRAMMGSKPGDVTPLLKKVTLEGEVEVARATLADSVRVTELTEVSRIVGSYGFAYQKPFDRLERLRKQYNLRKVIAGQKTELDRLVALRNWCRYTAPKGWDTGRTQWCPPWDALVILETNQDPRALCMCTHYSTLFVQTAAALGYTARHVILDHHCVAEVWSNELRKWILMDTGNNHDPSYNCHFEHKGIPINALELRRLWKAKRGNEIQIVFCGQESISGDMIDPKKHGFADFKLYRRFCIALRNNHLQTPFPGELTHGHGEYFCDAYLWYEDTAVPEESPEYGLTSDRPGDYYWPLNEVAIEPIAGDDEQSLTVELRTVTPNLEKFMVKVGQGKWREESSGFTWKLKPGRNVLQAKAVNSFGVQGPVSRAVVEM